MDQLPNGTTIFDVERTTGLGGSIARAGGTFCMLLKKLVHIRRCVLKLPSSDILSILYMCHGTKGSASNELHYRVKHGNAGRVRHLGHKPISRGVARNPVDHPHGGGEGKKSKKCVPRTA